MRYLLDTNVLSELVRPAPDANVVAWVRAQRPLDLMLSVLTIGELEQGIAALDDGHRRRTLLHWIRTELPRQLAGRILDIDTETAAAWGSLSGKATRKGRTIPVIDGLLLATALRHGLVMATHNSADFTGWGVSVVDPWNSV